MGCSNAFDYIAIQNTIARYCMALDSKDFNLLTQVFTGDVDAVYPFGGHIKSVQKVTEAIQRRFVSSRGNGASSLLNDPRLSPVTTQHALTTQHIEISEDGKSAHATTYFTGIHFGQGKWQGKEVTAWGKYIDQLILNANETSLPGASGQWLIYRREVTFMGRLGEERVMDGE